MKFKTAVLLTLLIWGVFMHSAAVKAVAAEKYSLNKYSVKWDYIDRTFYAFNEKAFVNKKPAPVLFVLHGGGGTADKLPKVMKNGFEKLALKDGFIVIYPQGFNNYWNDGRKIEQKNFSGADDVGFLNSLISYSVKHFNADPSRIYFTGLSNGGFMTTRMAFEKSDKIAAIAPVISNISMELTTYPEPSRPISVMIINGTADPLLPYNGGDIKVLGKVRGKSIPTDKTAEFWVKHNGCNKNTVKSELPDTDKNDGMTVTVFKWENGNDKTEVVLYRVNGGGHTWPGGRQYMPVKLIGRVCNDFDACEAIWSFFKTKNLIK
ncbi:MAG: phospholipase [Firmicutes bacterium]|nr:phospholipase [Bacillota bacterium]